MRFSVFFRIGMVAFLLLFYLPHPEAQGIYEVTYSFKNAPSIEYTALVFYYSDKPENNKMRIRYYYNNGWNIAEQSLTPIFFNSMGKNYWVLHGEHASVIDGPGKGTTYTPDKIFLSKEPGDTYYHPDFVSSKDAQGETILGTIASFKVLTRNDVTNDYLTSYDWHWNADAGNSSVGTLHVILVTNTNDVILGRGFYRNHEILASMFHDIERTSHVNLDLVELTGFDFSKEKLNNVISNMTIGSNDVIFFYYSGHGYNDRDGEWPHLDLRQNLSQDLDNNNLSLSKDVYSSLIAKNARLTIVVGDCCNRYRENSLTGTPVKDDPIMLAPSQSMLDASMLNTLFNKSGKMLIRASDIGEPSYYTFSYGGNFCHNFYASFINESSFVNTHGDVKWADIFTSAVSSTLSESPNGSDPQHAKYYYAIDEN